MNYEAAAQQAYARFQENYASDSPQKVVTAVEAMLEQQMRQTAELLAHAVNVSTSGSAQVLEAINRPRNRTVIRDAEGKISGVRDE